MKILIADDNTNNRMILRLMIEDYVEDNQLAGFEIAEAEDGLIALNMCKKESFDLIFMDIMMPNMNGIKATQEIRKIDTKTMIIAVSAVDDGDKKRMILNNGAEDYIAKPVNADIFVSRLSNYILLLETRAHKIENQQTINLFSTEIYSRHTTFILDSEDSLSEFWEFFLLNVRKKSDTLSDVVRTIFSIVEKQLSSSKNNILYIEESQTSQYFTLINIETIPADTIKLLLKKNSVLSGYKLTDKKLSFELIKDEQTVEEFQNTSPTLAKEIQTPIAFESSKELQVFNYLEDEDLSDLEEYASKLNSIMLLVGGGGITEDEVVDIYSYLEKLGSILTTYSEVYPIAQALTILSGDMSKYKDEFISNSEALGPMCKAFSNDMSNWIEQSFHTGAPSAEFMNDTIVVNCQTIGSMLKINEEAPASDDDFDDIFDF